jgi:hypothetical protein
MSENIIPETPKEYWRAIRFTPVDISDIKETYLMLGDEPDIRRDLGSAGIYMASRIRSYDYGTLTDETGRRFETKQNEPLWLASEAACLLESIEPEAERQAKLN